MSDELTDTVSDAMQESDGSMNCQMIYEHADDLKTAAEMVGGIAGMYSKISAELDRDHALTYLAAMAFVAVDRSDGAPRGYETSFRTDDILFIRDLITTKRYDPEAPERTKRAGLIADLWFETISPWPEGGAK